MKNLDFWFDFASTYSYPSAMRIGALARAAGVRVTFRPFLLGPIFKANGWDTSPFNLQPAKGRYMWRDLERLCDSYGLPFRRPDPFPQHSLLAARAFFALSDLDSGKVPDFCRAVFKAEFADGLQISEAATIARALQACGADADLVLAAATSDAVKAKLRAQTDEAQHLGLFGAPSFVTAGGEIFWGDDRLEAALAWTAQESR